jgi:DNA invertase Pin-like site-specific DNA recombinase
MPTATKTTTATRLDCVFIRKSGKTQDEQGQIDNVRTMLKAKGVYVPEEQWFIGVVKRRKVRTNLQFDRMLQMIRANRVGTVYVESQDRFGTGDHSELSILIRDLRDHDTKLFDLRANRELTATDIGTKTINFVNSLKSEMEVNDLAARSLRSRVSLMKKGSWPSPQPFGYGKRILSEEGKLLWEWHPAPDSRTLGQLFYADANGNLTPGPDRVPIPRKTAGARHVTKLVPSRDADSVRAVKMTFDLFVRVGLSRRQVSKRINEEGLTMSGKPFNHHDIAIILSNPAYAGDTVFGRLQSGFYQKFDSEGVLQPINGKTSITRRDLSDCLIVRDTHEPLVERKVFDQAQEMQKSTKTTFSPRSPDHYLKQLFVCGHCGKPMIGRTEKDPRTKQPRSVYVCMSYMMAQSGGHKTSPCGYQRISHKDAEQMLLDKMAELDRPLRIISSDLARSNLQKRLARLGHDDEAEALQWEQWFIEGINCFADYLNDTYGDSIDWPAFRKLKKLAGDLFLDANSVTEDRFKNLPMHLAELKRAVAEAEETATAKAKQKLDQLRQEHKALTLAWVKASELQQGVLKGEIDRLEADIKTWEPRATPLRERFEKLYKAEEEKAAEREKLRVELPKLENREKGEAFRKFFKKVTLFWDRQWIEASKNPTRPRKTNRTGRYKCTLDKAKTQWAFAETELDLASNC